MSLRDSAYTEHQSYLINVQELSSVRFKELSKIIRMPLRIINEYVLEIKDSVVSQTIDMTNIYWNVDLRRVLGDNINLNILINKNFKGEKASVYQCSETSYLSVDNKILSSSARDVNDRFMFDKCDTLYLSQPIRYWNIKSAMCNHRIEYVGVNDCAIKYLLFDNKLAYEIDNQSFVSSYPRQNTDWFNVVQYLRLDSVNKVVFSIVSTDRNLWLKTCWDINLQNATTYALAI